MLIFLGVILYGIIPVKKKDVRGELTASSAAERSNIPDVQNGQEGEAVQNLLSDPDEQNKGSP